MGEDLLASFSWAIWEERVLVLELGKRWLAVLRPGEDRTLLLACVYGAWVLGLDRRGGGDDGG